MGLAVGIGVAAGESGDEAVEPQGRDQPPRGVFRFVGADNQRKAHFVPKCQAVADAVIDPWRRQGVVYAPHVGDDLFGAVAFGNLARRRQGTPGQDRDAVADHSAYFVGAKLPASQRRERFIDGAGQFRGAVHQGSVEIEKDGGYGFRHVTYGNKC